MNKFDPRIPVRQEIVLPEIKREFDELRAENERLRADWQLAVKIAESHATENERLRAYVRGMHESGYPHPSDFCDLTHDPGVGWTSVKPDTCQT